MVGILIVLFIVVPILELAVFVQVSNLIGFFPALLLVVAFSVSGAWLVKREGIGVWRRAQAQIDQGELPAKELVNGLLILFAGVLMLTPGFLTDILGLFLLIPPTRALVRVVLMRRFERRIRDTLAAQAGAMFGAPLGGMAGDFAGDFVTGSTTRVRVSDATYSGSGVVDVHEVDVDAGDGVPSDRPELGRY